MLSYEVHVNTKVFRYLFWSEPVSERFSEVCRVHGTIFPRSLSTAAETPTASPEER